MLRRHHRVPHQRLQRVVVVDGVGPREVEHGADHLGAGLHRMGQDKLAAARSAPRSPDRRSAPWRTPPRRPRRRRHARRAGAPQLWRSRCGSTHGRRASERRCRPFRRRRLLGVVQRGAGDAEVDHREHLGGVGESRVTVERLVHGRGAAADERPLRGTTTPDDLGRGCRCPPCPRRPSPGRSPPDLGGAAPCGACRRSRLPGDADAEDVRAHAAAGELPPALEQESSRGLRRRLHGEQAAGEGTSGPSAYSSACVSSGSAAR